MKKETIIAIILGITMGTIIAFVLIVSAKKTNINGKEVITPKISPTLPPTPLENQQFEIREPKNESQVDGSSIKIKGLAQKGDLVIIQSATSEKTLKLVQPEFEADFPLTLGENIIRITSYHEKSSDDRILKIYRIED